jgi:ABC-2 type transport system permease protein
VLARLTVTELKLLVRERVRLIVGLGIPLVLVIIFGSIPFYHHPAKVFGGLTLLDVYVPILCAYSLAVLSLTVLPMVLADYRERGVLRRLQTTPAGPPRVLAAQVIVDLVLAAVAVALILAVARIGYGVFLPRQLAGFAVAALLAVAALMSIGLLIAALAPSGRAGMTIGQLVLLPMMFFAGLFIPIPAMSPAVQYAARGHWPHLLPLLTMAAYAVAFGLAAARLFRWE